MEEKDLEELGSEVGHLVCSTLLRGEDNKRKEGFDNIGDEMCVVCYDMD